MLLAWAFALADEWNEDRTAVLGVCLSSVRAWPPRSALEGGVPELPDRDRRGALARIALEHGACQLHDLDFALDLGGRREATSAPARSVRDVDVGPYCIGGPARTPHDARAIGAARATGTATLGGPADEGRYRMFVRGGAAAPVEVKAGAPREIHVRADEAGKSG